MIQDIFPKKYDNRYGQFLPRPQDMMMIFSDQKILLRKTGETLCLPRLADFLTQRIVLPENIQYLFAIDEIRFFLVWAPKDWQPDPNLWQWRDQTIFRSAFTGAEAFGGITAFQLYRWYRDNQFCGACGSRMAPGQDERALVCTRCGKVVYPRINPAVIIAVTDGDRLLMTQYAGGTYRRYALVAGFVEIGETFEETVRREVWEEVGLRVKNIRYFGSQPWSFSDTVMIGFFAELEGSDEITLERKELATARWFQRAEVPHDMHDISIGYELVRHFLNG